MSEIERLSSFVAGRWQTGDGDALRLVNPASEAPIAETSTRGIDFAGALDYSRTIGGPALRALTFAERGQCLKALHDAIYAHREELLELSIRNGGNTRNDAKFDVDGAAATLLVYAEHGAALGAETFLVDGETVQLARTPRYAGRHVLTPLRGVAVHINAFNFPAWGFAEKAAVALLAGMPVISKPATSTCLLACRIMEIAVESKAFPEGTLSLIAGTVGDLLDHVGPQDALAFTGSGTTGARLRAIAAHTEQSSRINVEADSLNAAILGRDVELGSETWQLMIREIVTDTRQKAGQKCTAIRRVLVPPERLEECTEALETELTAIVVGDPAVATVRMGPLVNAAQLADVRAGIAAFSGEANQICGDPAPKGLTGVPDGLGYFVTPCLFKCNDASAANQIHEREVFGPVVTVMSYDSMEEAVELCARGGGALVSSVYSDDRAFARELLLGLAPYHGRLSLGSSKVAGISPGPGTVLPALIHGGPGRAGGGEELGGLRGLSFYMQRTAIQGYRPLVERFFPKSTSAD